VALVAPLLLLVVVVVVAYGQLAQLIVVGALDAFGRRWNAASTWAWWASGCSSAATARYRWWWAPQRLPC
jgi:hypothetical protein